MDYQALLLKRDLFLSKKKSIHSSFEQDFRLVYTHNSTAIEGNTLTLMETKLILEDGISVGEKPLRELYEVVNHNKAYDYVQDCIARGACLDERVVKDIHAILSENIMLGGIYRDHEVRISGAGHTPPAGMLMYAQIKNFYLDLRDKSNDFNKILLAAWTHAEFVRIHPFSDGNGRTARLIMNYQLMAGGFPPVSVAKENRLVYYEALEQYAMNGDILPFAEMIAELVDKRICEADGQLTIDN